MQQVARRSVESSVSVQCQYKWCGVSSETRKQPPPWGIPRLHKCDSGAGAQWMVDQGESMHVLAIVAVDGCGSG